MIELTDFEQGPIRPPDEADSLLIRTTRGCPWNRCHFCTLFEGMRFSIRLVEDIKRDIFAAKQYFNGAPFKTCFLQDGDSFAMKTGDLVEVLTTLKQEFPSLEQISSYGRAQTMGRKSASEIREIHDAGLNMLYCGIESGADKVLETVRKGITSDAIIASTLRAKQAGMKLVTFVIFGLGGKELSQQHIDETAKLLNQIDPYNIRVLSLAVKEKTGLGEMIRNTTFTMLSETQMIEEQHNLIVQLNNIHSRYSNSHSVNLIPEIAGTLPDDKTQLLDIIDGYLSLKNELKLNYILGKRLGYYHSLTGFEDSNAFDGVQSQLDKIMRENPVSIELIFHELRNRMI